MSFAKIPEFYYVGMGASGTIKEFQFPFNTKRFTIQMVKNRDTNPRLVAFRVSDKSTGFTSLNYLSVPAGMNYYEEDVMMTTTGCIGKIYLQSLSDNAVAEISIWRY